MSGENGNFDLDGRSFHYEILEIHTIHGDTYTGSEMEDHLEDSDRIFYSVTAPDGQEFHRWLGGPYEDFDQLVEAIEDETGGYDEAEAA
jgi:hypothetical protein